MKNPYARLVIYNFDGVPAPDGLLEKDERFLGTWEEEETAFVFFSRPAASLIEQIRTRNPRITLVETYEMTCEQWHGDKIEPYFVENLCIAPPWDRPGKDEKPEFREILLDPGVVFGTGRHQTTEDCLTLVHRLCTREKIKTVLDIGTGTGILSLGAAALGCEKILACDFNLLAVKTTLKNIRLNGFENQILAFQARGEEVIPIPCDLLVANIHYDIMQHLIEHPSFLEKKWFVLSGLLNSETTRIMASLSAKKVHVIERRCPDGIWNTLLGKC
ncbi:MAG: 50S ribosomal protein L11 methyltransferase [Proteobacteria bacterium]|nr:50S ribosomal protein L11 methyltransferase [Pseudomonadota bacterium]